MRTRRAPLRRILALLVAGSGFLCGCMPVWHETEIRAVVAELPDSIRATTAAGQARVLTAPRISADTLVGFQWKKGVGGSRIAIPLPSVDKVERYDETGRWLSLGAVLLGTTALALATGG